MLVKECMTRHPIMISPTTPAVEAQKIMAENKVRHLPVVGDGKKLVGLVTRERLALKPDMVGSYNLWEITRYLSDLPVQDIMLKAKEVYTTKSDRTVERAAREMASHRIGCLPVIEEDIVVGILTEVDLLQAFQEMLGLPADGVRVTVRMPDREGEFAKLTSAVAQKGWGIMGIGSFPTPKREGFYDVVMKIPKVTISQLEDVLNSVEDQEVVDIREVV